MEGMYRLYYLLLMLYIPCIFEVRKGGARQLEDGLLRNNGRVNSQASLNESANQSGMSPGIATIRYWYARVV